MLTTLSVLSLDQGKLPAAARDENAFYARFADRTETAQPALPVGMKAWRRWFLSLGEA